MELGHIEKALGEAMTQRTSDYIERVLCELIDHLVHRPDLAPENGGAIAYLEMARQLLREAYARSSRCESAAAADPPAEVVISLQSLVPDRPMSTRPVISLKFQSGQSGEVGVNGCTIEDVIGVLITRLEAFQQGPLWCHETRYVIEKLLSAQSWLRERTRVRREQGVEGTKARHVNRVGPELGVPPVEDDHI